MVEKKSTQKPSTSKKATTPHKATSHKKAPVKHTEKKPEVKKETKASHENKAEELEKKVANLEKKYAIADKILKRSWMKDFLGSKQIEDINKSIKPQLGTIFTVVAIFAFLSAVISFLAFFGLLGLAAFGISRGFILLMSVIVLISSLVSLLVGIGLVKKKRRLPSVVIISFGLQIISIAVGQTTIHSSGVMTWIGLLIMGVLSLIVLKNRDYFEGK